MNDIVFLVDVDNTLLDNDAVVADLKHCLFEAGGVEAREHYWELFEQLWHELGYADYLGAFQRYRLERPGAVPLMTVASYLLHYPFGTRLYPGALETIAALKQRGRVVLLSDGDAVQQPNKVERSGLFEAVDGHVLIYIHKEESLDDVERRYPAPHYVMVDDKLRILSAMKEIWGNRVTTVFVRQGAYAVDPAVLAAYPSADITIDRIDGLQSLAW